MRGTNYWVITDTHFGHDKLWKDGYRPKGFEEIIMNNCGVVGEQDVLIHLGDVSFYKNDYWHRRFISEVRGKKWLVLGNHDRQTLSWYLSRGWAYVGDAVKNTQFGEGITFTHEPIVGVRNQLNIHGHLHECIHREATENPNCLLLSIENTLAPINLRKLVDSWINRRVG